MKWISWLMLFLLLAMAISQLQRGGPILDRVAPTIQAPLLHGGSFDLEQHRGKIVILDFWATWCPPCKATLPALSKVYQEYKDDPSIQIFTVNSENITSQRLKKFLKARDLTFPVITDPRQNINNLYNIKALPTMVVINGEGVVKYTKIGTSTRHTPSIIAQIKDLINSMRSPKYQ